MKGSRSLKTSKPFSFPILHSKILGAWRLWGEGGFNIGTKSTLRLHNGSLGLLLLQRTDEE